MEADHVKSSIAMAEDAQLGAVVVMEEGVHADGNCLKGDLGVHNETAVHEPSSKRPADDGEDAEDVAPAKKRARAEDTEGYRKVLLTGLKGMPNDTLKGCLERLGIPLWRLWKKTENDVAEIWLPEERAIIAGCCRMLDTQSLKGKVVRIDYQGNDDVKEAPSLTDGSEQASKRSIIRQVASLHDMSYEDQLSFKASLLRGSLRKLTLAMISECASKERGVKGAAPDWVRLAKRGPIVPVSAVHQSPVVCGYRNKNEFTIGFDTDKQPQVGFRYGRFTDGRSGVGCADACPNIPEEALAVARCLKDFIVNHQKLECWGPEKHTGVWRQLTVRHSSIGDLLAVVQYSSNNCSRADLDETLDKLKNFFLEQVAVGKMRLTSLFCQEHNAVSNKAADDAPMKLLWGAECFFESLLDLKFRISPMAFFQVNTKAAEVLNNLIREWACASDEQVVLDVCCGTGTIGMCIASHAKKVVGIELCEPAVRDAEANARLNNIDNCVFLAGRAEAKIREAIRDHVPDGGSCVAVVDPPREGLHHKVLTALRSTKEIERIVYVSCNHVNIVEQAVKLCSPHTNKYPGEPFEVVMANGVDLFPHTPHVELVILLERGATLARRKAGQTASITEAVSSDACESKEAPLKADL